MASFPEGRSLTDELFISIFWRVASSSKSDCFTCYFKIQTSFFSSNLWRRKSRGRKQPQVFFFERWQPAEQGLGRCSSFSGKRKTSAQVPWDLILVCSRSSLFLLALIPLPNKSSVRRRRGRKLRLSSRNNLKLVFFSVFNSDWNWNRLSWAELGRRGWHVQ